MHETLLPSVKGYIDSYTDRDNGLCEASGWTLCRAHTLRAKCGDMFLHTRPDVSAFYGVPLEDCIGWTVQFPSGVAIELQANTGEDWGTVFVLEKESIQPALSTYTAPTYIVVDNFYKDPDQVRAFALGCSFQEHVKYHKGSRTDMTYRFPGLKERFEQILGRPVLNWEKYGTNGCFQFCIGGDQIVYHHDTQQYAGVLYLTPGAPANSGTSLYRSKRTLSMNGYDGVYSETYPTGHLDPAQFECVDTVGNVYNRLILFDSRMIHAATSYFGDSKENGRLFQLFFFDLVAV